MHKNPRLGQESPQIKGPRKIAPMTSGSLIVSGTKTAHPAMYQFTKPLKTIQPSARALVTTQLTSKIMIEYKLN
jgi:hypothetical protein